jgi:transposase
MSEMESLASRAAELSAKVDFWNSMVLYALLATAMVGAAIFFSQRLANVRAKQLADVMGKMAVIKEAKVASLQKDAIDAKAAQQRVEISLAEQQEKAATAEHSLLLLQRRMEPRKLSGEQKARLLEILKHRPKGKISIMSVMGDQEGSAFASDIETTLRAAGWETGGGAGQSVYTGGNPIGLGILVKSGKSAPVYAGELQQAFFSIGVPLAGAENATLPDGTVEIVVGNKPN